MSSLDVRDAVITFLDTNSSEDFIALDGHYENVADLVEASGLTSDDPWVGVQFIGNDEVPITIGSNNTTGKYRESGAIYIHVVDVAKLGVSGTILTRAETLRDLLRGVRIGSIFIESMTPVNFGPGAALQFEDGYMCGTFILGYLNDIDL